MVSAIGEPIRLHEGPAPGSEGWTHEERAYFSVVFDTPVVTNVVAPRLTPVLPSGAAEPAIAGTAVIVAPGGGYHALSIDSEGFDVAHRLAESGIAAFVLAYRLVPCGDDAVAEFGEKVATDPDLVTRDIDRIAPLAAADGAAAVRLVRERGASFGVRSDRVGFMGFSAGGNVALRVAHHPDAGARPDFLAPIYATAHGVDLGAPPAGAGPMFVAAASDDDLGLTADSVQLYECWRRAGLPVELHMYARGGHGFGMRTQHLPSDTWIDRFVDWLHAGAVADAAV
jgi:acetyl esterase/lipase